VPHEKRTQEAKIEISFDQQQPITTNLKEIAGRRSAGQRLPTLAH
jgi:flagellar basal body-associated protein FliL